MICAYGAGPARGPLMMRFASAAAIGLLVVLGARTARADVFTLAPTDDGWCEMAQSMSTNGTGTTFDAGRYRGMQMKWYTYRGLLKFDLGSLPAGFTVTGATLSLYFDCSTSRPARAPVDLYRSASDAWTESAVPMMGLSCDALLASQTPGSTSGYMTWNLLPAWNPADDRTDGLLSLAFCLPSSAEGQSTTYYDEIFRTKDYAGTTCDPLLTITGSPASVPEPATLLLLGSGTIGGLGRLRRRGRR